MTTVVIHSNPAIRWQREHTAHMVSGLSALGFEVYHSEARERIRDTDCAVVFGTTFFKAIEADEYDTLLVDRASWGDPDQVQLVWNGRLRNGDHCVPADYMDRPRPVPERKPLQDGERVVLCGQVGSNGAGIDLDAWYTKNLLVATHFKPHPAQFDNMKSFHAPTLPMVSDFTDCGTAITLNSSVGVECLLNGIDAIADDPSAMIYPYSEGVQSLDECLQYIAWTQWRWSEIADGEPIRHLFDGRDRRVS